MESRYKYAVFAAGAVAKCLIGKLPSKTGEVGPVAAVSYRVASRIANTLRAGYPVRAPDELDAAAVILFHAPPNPFNAVAPRSLPTNQPFGRSKREEKPPPAAPLPSRPARLPPARLAPNRLLSDRAK